MHINWGVKITIFYIGFVALILTMVGMTMNQKIDLVSKDYYEQELKYQNKIDKIKRTHTLLQQLSYEINKKTLLLKFPSQFKGQQIKGVVYFFRPSDEKMDKIINFSAIDTSLVLKINTNQFKKGLYKIEIDWETNNEKYYNENSLKFN